jgi:hypothetical protein
MTKSGTTWINSLFCEGRLQVNQQARPQRRAKGRRVTRIIKQFFCKSSLLVFYNFRLLVAEVCVYRLLRRVFVTGRHKQRPEKCHPELIFSGSHVVETY